ncbi:hypothetical protein [Pseudoduganella chitinolytica]|uniref:Uncharacterized protein n=1 Tax=Pseudoduganella chitinolytica TaxID=34070 RepID=A0ABY8BJ10_9BURK|nr:hypothetical protein [Pseudoduganella chitinolytica]WEF34911.1 hypothetical protein PX653_09165 [Pseudoduganella chitinolytica]
MDNQSMQDYRYDEDRAEYERLKRKFEAKPSASTFEQCTHPTCGRFKDGQGWSCRAMADNACARSSASAVPGIDTPVFRNLLGYLLDAYRKELQGAASSLYEDARPGLIKHIDTAIAAAHEAGRQEAIPPGYVLVPVEPTPEMLAEMVSFDVFDSLRRWPHVADAVADAMWKNTCKLAAPHPQAKAQEPASCDCVSGDTYKPYGCEKCNPDLAQGQTGEQSVTPFCLTKHQVEIVCDGLEMVVGNTDDLQAHGAAERLLRLFGSPNYAAK